MFLSEYKKHLFIFQSLINKKLNCLFIVLLSQIFYINSSYATGLIPDSLLYIETDKKAEYVIIVEKETQKMFIYSHNDVFQEIKSFKCSTGEMTGSKSQSGDRKTPEGVYFFTNSYKKRDLTPIYGTRAFPIDYPNFMDRFAGKNGSAIWVHGTNKRLKPRDTNGCVAMVNKDIEKLDKYISLNRTPIIIQKKINLISSKQANDEGKSILNFIRNHENSIINASKDSYFKPYTYFKFFVPGWWDGWEKIRKEMLDLYLDLKLNISNILITRQDKIFVALFDQYLKPGVLKAKQNKKSQKKLYIGTKKVFLIKQQNNFNIIGEEYQKSPYIVENQKNEFANSNEKSYPLVTAVNYLMGSIEAYEKITSMIDDWIEAWSSKDIEKYGSHYAKDFRAKGKDKAAWLRYKKRLNNHYEFIKITRKELKIKPGKLKTRVSFEQTYASSGYKAKGIKSLILKRVGGKWKIYRETWKKL